MAISRMSLVCFSCCNLASIESIAERLMNTTNKNCNMAKEKNQCVLHARGKSNATKKGDTIGSSILLE